MRTTVDVPDELLRRAKSKAALSGRKLKDVIEEGLRAVVDNASPEQASEAEPKKVTAHDLLKDLCGIIEDAPSDLSTNKKYLEDLGR